MTLVNEFFNNYKMSEEDLITAFFEARSGAMGTKEDFDSPLNPTCSNPKTGFSKSFTTIRQAAEWVIDDDDDNVPRPFGSVKPSKYSVYPWANLPKRIQNSVMCNILNAACKKEAFRPEDRFRDSGYGLVWELNNPEDIINDEVRCAYDEGHGSTEDRATLKAKYAAEKTEKAEKAKQEKIDFINKNKDWAISKLKQFINKKGISLFDSAECEPNYGYPAWGISGYFSNNFDKHIECIQKGLDEKMAAKGKKARSLVKYFQYLDEVAKDLGLNVEDDS